MVAPTPEPSKTFPGAIPIGGAAVQAQAGDIHSTIGSDAQASNGVSSQLPDQWGAAGPIRELWTQPTGLHDVVGLGVVAETVNDLENIRKGFASRLLIMTTPADKPDKDGRFRGMGLLPLHPDVIELTELLDQLTKVENKAVRYLEKLVRKRHPLGPWIKAQKGIGDKQAGRLLATIGDPYWNSKYNRPRTVRELWRYCGMDVTHDDNGAGAAPTRRKGQKTTWNPDARTRIWLIADKIETCGRGGKYRQLYDDIWAQQKELGEALVHRRVCVRCGPEGKPAQPGSPLSDQHKKYRRLRAVAKKVLEDMWKEARRIHLEEM